MKIKNYAKQIILGILLVGVISGGIFLYNLYRTPLGVPLVLNPPLTVVISPDSPATTRSPSAPQATFTPSPVAAMPEPTENKVCGQSGAMTILIIGSDAGDLRGRPGADLTRLTRVNFSDKKVSMFAFPRDLWVDARGLGFENPLITETTMGEIYYEAYLRSTQIEEAGKMRDSVQVTAQMMLNNFNVTSDHYISIALYRLPDLVDAIGGLPIDIPQQITDPWIGTVIEGGPQVLTGEQLISYARAIPDSDFARIQRSDLILDALRSKLLEPGVWIKLPQLIEEFNDMLVTDLSPEQILDLFCLMQEVRQEGITMKQVEAEWTSPGPSNSLLWDLSDVSTALKQLDLIP